MSLIVYTTIFGHTDPLHEPACRTSARLICYTDQPIRSDRWEIVRVPPIEQPTRMSRMAKAMSHDLIRAPWSLWIDAAFTLLQDPLDLIDTVRGDFTNFIHPDRARITDEAEAIIELGKAPASLIRPQLAAYRADGFDTPQCPQVELSANGVILRRHTPEIERLNLMWANEIQTRSLRDQMSLDYCAWKFGVNIDRWPGTHRKNPYFKYNHYNRPVNDV